MIPLSTRMRPDSLDKLIGQEHFFYEGSLLYNAVKNKTFGSALFYGPPGTGKTTMARLIAQEMDADFYELNASTTGTKELKELLDRAKGRYFGLQKEHTYLYLDEVHRWNKLQQDSLLKALEEGTIRFIGSTTENPYFTVNNAVLSRIRSIYEFKRLSDNHVLNLIKTAIQDTEKGLGNMELQWDETALELLADMSSGDARIALDTLGFLASNIPQGKTIDGVLVQEAMQKQTRFYDRKEDQYNLLSALQKSIRGSDPHASIHYLARLIDGGADPQTIGRRLLVIASEDVGLAYPSAVTVVTSCVQAALIVGFPEARINLAEAVILLASCPKSNAVILAIDHALKDLESRSVDDVPLSLKDAHYKGAKDRGIGTTYKYPHDYGGYVEQQYLPDNLFRDDVTYYRPTENGKEGFFKRYLESLRKK